MNGQCGPDSNRSGQTLLDLWDREVGDIVPPEWLSLVNETYAEDALRETEVVCRDRHISL